MKQKEADIQAVAIVFDYLVQTKWELTYLKDPYYRADFQNVSKTEARKLVKALAKEAKRCGEVLQDAGWDVAIPRIHASYDGSKATDDISVEVYA